MCHYWCVLKREPCVLPGKYSCHVRRFLKKSEPTRGKLVPQYNDMSHRMGKPTICIGENKGADQLRRNCEADQRLCFRYSDSTIPLLSKSKILQPLAMQAGLCRTWSEPKLLVFSRTGSNVCAIFHSAAP